MKQFDPTTLEIERALYVAAAKPLTQTASLLDLKE
jgi:hypothetical protein